MTKIKLRDFSNKYWDWDNYNGTEKPDNREPLIGYIEIKGLCDDAIATASSEDNTYAYEAYSEEVENHNEKENGSKDMVTVIVDKIVIALNSNTISGVWLSKFMAIEQGELFAKKSLKEKMNIQEVLKLGFKREY